MKTYHFSTSMQRQNLAFALLWGGYMLFQLGRLLHDLWSGDNSVPTGVVWLSVFSYVGAVLTMPFSVLAFCTTYEIDENGITQYTPCLAPIRINWDDIKEVRLRMFGLQIKSKNHRKPLKVSIHIDRFRELWKTVEEKSGHRALQ